MTKDLTEQWKNGELKTGWYYVLRNKDIKMLEYDGDYFLEVDVPLIKDKDVSTLEVLASVPSYEELKNITNTLDYEYKGNLTLREENERLKKLNQRLQRTQARQFRDNKNLQIKAEKAKDVVDFDKAQKIKQLKELLKECKHIIEWYKANYNDVDVLNEDVITKIDNAIGEK